MNKGSRVDNNSLKIAIVYLHQRCVGNDSEDLSIHTISNQYLSALFPLQKYLARAKISSWKNMTKNCVYRIPKLEGYQKDVVCGKH